MSQSITISSIGDFRDYEHRLSGFCNGCQRYIELDLEALAQRFGLDLIRMAFGTGSDAQPAAAGTAA